MTGALLLAGACVALAGCKLGLEASCWLPDFQSVQVAGGGTALDLDTELGVVADEQVFVYDIIGDAGRNRGRLTYWTVSGAGTSDTHGDFDFNTISYTAGDPVTTEMSLEAIGILWEPALFMNDKFRLRIEAGADLLRFRMSVDGTPGLNVVEVPPSDAGFAYMPVPKVGVGFEIDFSNWTRFEMQAQMFDASYLNLDPDFSGTFTNAVAGMVFGRHRGVRVFTGYRYFNADYSYDTGSGEDSGDSTLQGFVASASVRF